MVDPAVLRAFVRQFGAEATRKALYSAADDLVAAATPTQRRTPQRAPAEEPDKNIPVDDLARRRAEQALGLKK